jgi:tRNA threonylcarbamoyladenosine biosynthesis protein TsaE
VSALAGGGGGRRSESVTETEALGAELAPHLEAGDVVVLSGPLGAGKTRFVAGLARGLECKARVRSPSFTLVNEYRGRLLLVHLDLYRVEPPAAEELGIEEQAERGVLVVEWGERLPAALRERAFSLEFEVTSETGRRITARAAAGAHGARAAALLAAWDAGAVVRAPARPRQRGRPA